MINTCGTVAAVAILAAYAYSTRRDNPLPFHWANALLWVPVAIPSILAGVWGAALLTISFGAIGTFGVADHYRKKPK